jgi:ABC-type branched-subunit amino acid transport system substrate-binding protein
MRIQEEFNIDTTPFAETSYDSIMMLAQVVNDAKSTKPADLQKGFNAVKGFKGITGDLGFSEKNHITINAEQLTLVKYHAASKQWVEVKD